MRAILAIPIVLGLPACESTQAAPSPAPVAAPVHGAMTVEEPRSAPARVTPPASSPSSDVECGPDRARAGGGGAVVQPQDGLELGGAPGLY